MNFFDKNFKEIALSQIVSLVGGVIAGALLAVYTDKILLIPGMLVLLPGFLEMRGNISGSFASRLTSGLFLGVIKPKNAHTKLIQGNLAASFLMVAMVSFALGLMAFVFSFFVLGVFVPKLILLAVLAGFIANGFEILLTLHTTLYLFSKGHDPNNIMGPFITSTGDITSIVALLLVLVII